MLLLQLLEGVGRVQLVQHVSVDIDEITAIGAPPHQMGLPDLVEQGLGHGLAAYGLNFVADRSGAAIWRHLGRADHPTQAAPIVRPLFRATDAASVMRKKPGVLPRGYLRAGLRGRSKSA
jgi:hypothetical protein